MKNLPEEVRNKAIEIANALLEEKNMDEGMAVATAISHAREWAVNHGKASEASAGEPLKKDQETKQHDADREVIPHRNKWADSYEKGNKQELLDTKQKSMKEEKNEAGRSAAPVAVQEKYGKTKEREFFNPNWRAPKQR